MTKSTLQKRALAASLLFFVLLILCPASVTSAAEKETIPATRFLSTDLVRGVPPGWSLDRRAGTANLRIEKDREDFVVHLISDRKSSFGIRRELRVNLKEYPILNWRWKATRLPQGGDVRKGVTNDQAVQLYVAFPSTGFPAMLNTPVLGYVWDNEAPHGWTGRCDRIGGSKLRYMVIRNKTDRVGEWYTERRNLYEDFKNLFQDLKGVDAVTVGMQLHINSNNTKSDAEGWIGDVFFSRDETGKQIASTAPVSILR
jgi:hypothetical protein